MVLRETSERVALRIRVLPQDDVFDTCDSACKPWRVFIRVFRRVLIHLSPLQLRQFHQACEHFRV
jgi:hypothetical protein